MQEHQFFLIEKGRGLRSNINLSQNFQTLQHIFHQILYFSTEFSFEY